MRKLLIAVSLVVLAFALALSAGCCTLFSSAESQSEGGGTDGRETSGGGMSLEAFLDADTKTGEYAVTRTDGETGEVSASEGKFWVDGRLFRYDLSENGQEVRSILTPDGTTAYFAQHDEQICEPSVASVDYYLAEYSQPSENANEDGTDEESGATRVVYTLKRTDDMAGANNPWYTEDITYLVKDDIVIGIISRGTIPADDGSIGPLDVSRKMFSNVKAGVPIPAEMFVLPYPIQAAE